MGSGVLVHNTCIWGEVKYGSGKSPNIQHIIENHGLTKGRTNASRFDTDDADEIKSLVEEAIKHGTATPVPFKPGQFHYDYDFGKNIGTSLPYGTGGGLPTTKIQVVFDSNKGLVKTAYPK